MSSDPPPPINRWNYRDQRDRKLSGALIALIITIILHLVLIVFLQRIHFFSKIIGSDEIETDEFYVDQVVLEEPEITPEDIPETLPDVAEQQESIQELDDVLASMKNQDIDISTQVQQPELAIKMSAPAKAGDLDGIIDDLVLSDSSLSLFDESDIDVTDNTLAADGQIILDLGSIEGELLEPTDVLDTEIAKGVGGLSSDGVTEGYSSLDELISMSDVNLQGARAALPSDLLYEYDSAALKSGARFGLMKLAMLISRNPEMYCVLEGHTDTFGDKSYNEGLSRERAKSVRTYLVNSLGQSSERIIIRGYGMKRPLIFDGSIEEQAPNRRVDILMRKEIPPVLPSKPRPKASEDPKPEPKKRQVVKAEPIVPEKAIVVEDSPQNEPEDNSVVPQVEVPEEITKELPKPIEKAIIVEEQPDDLPKPSEKAIVIEDVIEPAIVVEEPKKAVIVEPKRTPILVKPLRDPNIEPPKAIVIEE